MIGPLSLERPVLVVDDTDSTRYSTRRILTAAGAQVLEAMTGQQALAQAAACSAVILDINLPDLDGFGVCRALRADPATAHLPIIHLTAQYLLDADRTRGLDAGADAFLTHPVDPGVLVATLKAMLRVRLAKQAEAQARARLEAVFQAAPVGIGVLSQDGTLEEGNPEFNRIFDIAVPPPLPLAELPPPLRSAHLSGRGGEHDAQTRRWSANLTVPDAAGPGMHLDLQLTPLGDAKQLLVVVDQTQKHSLQLEREHALEREQQARAEAEDANRAKDTFLALLSHELRNPLNTISVWTSLLRMPEAAGKLHEGLDAIARSVALQAKLVGDLLDVARLSTGKLNLVFESVDAARVVREATDSLHNSLAEKQLHLDLQLVSELLLQADPSRLHQIIWNLLSNAIKFSHVGGRIVLRLAVVAGEALLEVRDEGAGIAADFLPQLFERFRQSHGSRRGQSGLGLGLSVVKSLVELHGGRIAAYSEGPLRGASFTVHLPLAQHQHESAVKCPLGESNRPLGGTGILIVEDNDEVRRILQMVLEQYGAEVWPAASAEEAEQLLERVQPDLLVSDIGLPGKDGLRFLRELRARGHVAARVPAIALTAYAREQDVENARSAGFHAHIAKPVDANKLLNLAVHLLRDCAADPSRSS